MFWTGVVLAGSFYLAVWLWALSAQSRYFRLCRESGVTDLPTPDNYPMQLFSGGESLSRLLSYRHLLNLPQERGALEDARRRARYRLRVARMMIIPVSVMLFVAVVAGR